MSQEKPTIQRNKNSKTRGWLDRAMRGLRLKLVVPMLRGKHPAEYIARGVAVGVALALTPLVGIQIPLVLFCWLIIKKWFPNWDFHPGIAMAWTLLTNVVTLPFFYYGFLVTGRILLGRWDSIRDFDTFYARMNSLLPTDSGWLQSIFYYLNNLLIEFGWPMAVGCLPWAIIGSWIGYRWSLRLVIGFRSHRRSQIKTDKDSTTGDSA